MPKTYKTNKGTREFDDKLTRQEIEAQLINEGVTEYEEDKPRLKSISEVDPQKLRSMFGTPGQVATRAVIDEPLDFTNAAASFARPMASRAVAGAVMSRIPNPVARVLGGILGYAGTDQIGQELQNQFTGGRPKGAIEQIVEPGNEVVGRLMGTAENAAIDWGAGKVVNAGMNAAKGIYNKFFPTLSPIPPKVGVTGHSFREDPIKDAQYWDIPNPKPTQPSIAGYGNDAAAAEYQMLKAKPIDQLSSTERLRLAGIERKLLGEKTKTIDLPGQTIHLGDGKITDPKRLLGAVAFLGAPDERKAKMKIANGPIPEFELALQDKQALTQPDTRDDLRAYWIQSRLQNGNAIAALNEPVTNSLYTPNERKELGAFFKAADEKKLPPDIQLTPKGVEISGPMAQEAGLGGYMLAIGIGEFARRILLKQGTRAAAKAIADYAAGNASKIPARKMGKYFLRNALRGADVLLQTAEGEKEVTVE